MLLPKQGPSTRENKIWIGDGLPAIPKKVYEKIANWEFVDLAELKPAGALDAINPDPDPQKYIILPGLEITRARRKPIRDIITWVQCFAVFMAAVHKQDPPAVKELLAYMFTIIRAAQEFEDPAWKNYDEAFREKAAATGNRKWSAIDTLIYNRVFTGHAKKIQIAPSSGSHNAITTPARSLPAITPMPQGSYADLPPTKRPALSPSAPARSDICYLFNRGSCHYGNVCKFRHMCSACSGRHPRIACKAGKPTPGPKDQGIAKP